MKNTIKKRITKGFLLFLFMLASVAMQGQPKPKHRIDYNKTQTTTIPREQNEYGPVSPAYTIKLPAGLVNLPSDLTLTVTMNMQIPNVSGGSGPSYSYTGGSGYNFPSTFLETILNSIMSGYGFVWGTEDAGTGSFVYQGGGGGGGGTGPAAPPTPPAECVILVCTGLHIDKPYLVPNYETCKCDKLPRPWYVDFDGDGYHAGLPFEVFWSIESPGIDWKKTTLGEDCDDDDKLVTTNCYKDWFRDNDGDNYEGATEYSAQKPILPGKWFEGKSLGIDCDDNNINVYKLNKCGKCEVEPVNGICNDRDCIENNTNNLENIKPSEAELSQKAINLLKAIETLSLVPYDDATGKPTTKYVKGATIGYGHLITDEAEFEKYKNGISESSANTLFTNDINREIKSLRKTSHDLSQNQFDALAILVFNIGTQFNSSSLRKFLEDCDAKTNYSSVENAWKAFNKDNGITLQGLINRRICEWDIFVNGIYKQW